MSEADTEATVILQQHDFYHHGQHLHHYHHRLHLHLHHHRHRIHYEKAREVKLQECRFRLHGITAEVLIVIILIERHHV